MAANTDSNHVAPQLELDQLLLKAAGVAETLMHDPSIPDNASNTAWVIWDLVERAKVAYSHLHNAAPAIDVR